MSKNNKKNNTPTDSRINEDIRNLVIERIKTAPSDLRVSIGSKEYSKEELLPEIRNDTDVGKEIITIQMDYLKDMASGAIYQNE